MNPQNSVFINSEDIIEIRVVGNQTGESVQAMGKEAAEALATLKSHGKPGLILDDLTKMGQTDTAARQMVSKLSKSLPFKKVAMLGQSTVLMRVGTKLLLQAIGMSSKIK